MREPEPVALCEQQTGQHRELEDVVGPLERRAPPGVAVDEQCAKEAFQRVARRDTERRQCSRTGDVDDERAHEDGGPHPCPEHEKGGDKEGRVSFHGVWR